MPLVNHLDVSDVVLIAAAVLGQDPVTVHRRMRLDIVHGALLAPAAEIDGALMHESVEARAAVLCARLAQGRPLASGSTRVAWIATREFVRRNGFDVDTDVDPDEIIVMLESLAAGLTSDADFARWLGGRLYQLQPSGAS